MTADALTKPERNCSRAQSKKVRELVVQDGGCCYCTKRSHLFDTVGRIAACGLDPPKAFPACIAFPGGFDFDEPAFREGAGRTLTRKDNP